MLVHDYSLIQYIVYSVTWNMHLSREIDDYKLSLMVMHTHALSGLYFCFDVLDSFYDTLHENTTQSESSLTLSFITVLNTNSVWVTL